MDKPKCLGCEQPLRQIPKVFAKEKFGQLYFCENEACRAFEQKVEYVEGLDWGI